MTNTKNDVLLLIAAVGESAAAVEEAAHRVERARADQIEPAVEDLALVAGWLQDVARIAVFSCDEQNPISKELGARLEDHSSILSSYLIPSRQGF